MASRIALSILFLIATACGHSDGLRVEWSEPPESASVEESTNGEPVEVVEYREFFIADDDELTLDIEGGRPSIVMFYELEDDTYRAYRLGCAWQAHRCTGFLPRDARDSDFVVLRTKDRDCPPFRLFREGIELEVGESFLDYGCGFVLR